MAKIFEKTPLTRPKTNRFRLDFTYKTTTDMGKLVPFLVHETLPGENYQLANSLFARFMALLSPMMDEVNADVHYFYVPNRILWKQWEKFIEEAASGNYSVPHLEIKDSGMDVNGHSPLSIGELADYFTLPVTNGHDFDSRGSTVNALPFLAYKRIWYDYYRDENFIKHDYTFPDSVIPGPPPVPVYNDLDDDYYFVDGDNVLLTGNDARKLLGINYRAWNHDYFTSALPSPQKGPEAVMSVFAVGSQAPVKTSHGADGAIFENILGGVPTGPAGFDATGILAQGADVVKPRGWYADLNATGALGITISAFRKAVALQEFLERDMRAGSRYVEAILAQFGYRVKDYRIDRPILIGGSRQPVVVSEVLQTSETSENSPQGSMAGHAISAGSGKPVSFQSPEHGFIIGILSIMPKTSYFQGIDKKFLRRDAFDYAYPAFQAIGEQEILKKEVFYEGDPVKDDLVFGYIMRYGEYRHNQNRITGDFRDSLKYWTLAREFVSNPYGIALNKDFIEFSYDKRIFAVQDAEFQPILVNIYNYIRGSRPLSRYGNPKQMML